MKQLVLSAAFIATAFAAPVAAESNSASRQCMAENLYHEARGEEAVAIVAVGKVVMNRVDSKRFPNTVCGVVRQGGERRHKCQFSWRCDGRSDKIRDARAWKKMLLLADVALSRQYADPTNGATFYHATTVSPYWIKDMQRKVQLGRHIFY